jgi:heme A synthase
VALHRLLAGAIGLQYLLGVLTLVLGVPVVVAALHQATALAIVGVWVAWLHHVRTLGILPQP